MSQLKRRDKNRKDGKPYRPRSAWKQQRDRIPKKTKPKPYRIERRIVDWGTTPVDRRRLMVELLKGFSTAEGWQRLGRYHTEEDAQKALRDVMRNKGRYNRYNIIWEYRIVFVVNKTSSHDPSDSSHPI